MIRAIFLSILNLYFITVFLFCSIMSTIAARSALVYSWYAPLVFSTAFYFLFLCLGFVDDSNTWSKRELHCSKRTFQLMILSFCCTVNNWDVETFKEYPKCISLAVWKIDIDQLATPGTAQSSRTERGKFELFPKQVTFYRLHNNMLHWNWADDLE